MMRGNVKNTIDRGGKGNEIVEVLESMIPKWVIGEKSVRGNKQSKSAENFHFLITFNPLLLSTDFEPIEAIEADSSPTLTETRFNDKVKGGASLTKTPEPIRLDLPWVTFKDNAMLNAMLDWIVLSLKIFDPGPG